MPSTVQPSLTEKTYALQLGDITIDVVQKNIKHIHLSVYPPTGRVHISAPLHASPNAIRLFAISKLSWIKRQQQKHQQQEREFPREFLDRESHYLWGKRYLLKIIEKDLTPRVEIQPKQLILQVRPGTSLEQKRAILDRAYRQQLKQAIPPLIAKWEKLMAVQLNSFTVRKMRTKWGSCSPERRTIRLNLELAKKPAEYLEYVIVHEMTHLLEPTHNRHFIGLMDQYMPKWRFYRDELNRLPLTC